MTKELEIVLETGEMSFQFDQFLNVEKEVDKFLNNKENLQRLIAPLLPENLDEIIDNKIPIVKDGEDGLTPTDEQLIALIEPRIPEPLKGDTPKKGIDYFTKKELEEVKKSLKVAIMSEMTNHVTKEEVNIKLEEIKKQINKLPTTGGAQFLRQLMDVNVGTPTAQQYGLTYNPSRSEFSLTSITGGGSTVSVNGVEVTDPNLEDTAEIAVTATGSDVNFALKNGSIDESKLDTSVNASLDLADTAVQPAGLAPYELLANKSTSTSLGTSDTLYPTQNAVKTYADNLVVGLLDYRGAYDASVNTFPASGGSGTAGAVLKGDMWIIDTAGTLGGSAVQIGDSIIANVDTPGQTAGNWNILNGNISYVPENVANKVTSLSGASTDTEYPSAKLTYDQLALKVTANGAITGATKTKITYDTKGLVTAGADATTADIADSTNKRYVTDADLTDIGNLSGTNTGDQTITNSSDATSHTVTLSASGGSVQLIEGTGITLTTGGTGSAGTVTIAASGGSGATTALDNLASVAINTSLVSDTDNTDNLGSTLIKWANLFVTTIGATATRVTKGWFTDIESTNIPTVGGTPILSSLTAPQFTTVELGHATDTTLSRVSAGVVAVEGKTLANFTDGGTFAADISVPDEAYGVGWNGSVEVPTKNAVYDKIETLSAFSPTTTQTFFDDFMFGNETTGSIGEQGWSFQNVAGTSSIQVLAAGSRAGNFRITTGGTDNNGGVISAGGGLLGGSNQYPMAVGNRTIIFSIKPTNTSDICIRCGLASDSQSDPISSGIYFELDTDVNPNWRGACNGASTTYTSSTTAPTTSYKQFKIVMDATAANIEFFIDSVSLGSISTNITGNNGELFFQVLTRTSGAKAGDIDYMYMTTTGLSR